MRNERERAGGERFVDLTMDAGFKAVLAAPENIDVLKNIVNAFMPEDRQVESLEFADREIDSTLKEGKGVRLDLRCRTSEGKNIIIEMQKRSSRDFYKRSLFYFSKTYGNNISQGQQYGDLEPVYIIAFMVEPLLEPELQLPHGKVSWLAMADVEYKHLAPDGINVIFVRLNEIGSLSECTSVQEKYMYYISNMSSFADCPPEDAGTDFERLFQASERANFNEEQMNRYDLEMIYEMDLQSIIATSNEEYLQKGIEKGIEKGINEGAYTTKRNIAGALLNEGFNLEMISRITGLPMDELLSLQMG